MSEPTGTASPTTVVPVHGAFADASSWNGVIKRLQAQGVPVTAPANPLRAVSADSAYIAGLLQQIPRPVVAVGHSPTPTVARSSPMPRRRRTTLSAWSTSPLSVVSSGLVPLSGSKR